MSPALPLVLLTLLGVGEPPAGPAVVCLGDSITHKGYPEVLAKRLGVPVANAGVGGETTAGGQARLEKAVLAGHPKIVVLLYGTNDSRLAEPEVCVPVAKYEANLREMVARCRKAGAKAVLCTLPPIGAEAYFTRHRREPFAAAGGLEKVLAQYREAAVRASEAERVPVVDLNRLLPKTPEWLSPDGVHPTPEGNAIIAGLVAEALKPLLAAEEAPQGR